VPCMLGSKGLHSRCDAMSRDESAVISEYSNSKMGWQGFLPLITPGQVQMVDSPEIGGRREQHLGPQSQQPDPQQSSSPTFQKAPPSFMRNKSFPGSSAYPPPGSTELNRLNSKQ
jgi:hypothetical protein